MKRSTRKLLVVLVAVAVAAVVGFVFGPMVRNALFGGSDSDTPGGVSRSDTGSELSQVAQDLTVPWGLAVLPGGDLLVTERTGTLKRIGNDRRSYTIEGVTPTSEGGLLGLALDPEFADNRRIYLYLTTQTSAGYTNRIERYVYADDTLAGRRVIFSGIPGSQTHDGGRIEFGPDGFLYVATGDARNEAAAQDTGSLAGKILRITADGAAAPGNPFGNAVYSYGHRNPQGLAWDDRGRLWATEHGRSGAASGFDELNLIKPGANYGWPVIQGDETREGMETPVGHSGPDTTWAPASLTYADGSLFFGGLRGESLYEAKIAGDDNVTLVAHFREEFGRLRTVLAHDDVLFVTTSNTDGRGTPQPADDKIYRIRLSALSQ